GGTARYRVRESAEAGTESWCRVTQDAISVLDWMPSLFKMFRTCESTVRSEIMSLAATALLLSPCAPRDAVSASRRLSGDEPRGCVSLAGRMTFSSRAKLTAS